MNYLKRNGYVMFYYVLGEKVLRIGEMNFIMKDLSAAYQFQPERGSCYTTYENNRESCIEEEK